MLDEPTAGVDPTTTLAVLEFISRIIKERNITVLLVTHYYALVRDHAEQVVWLHHGRVLCGTAAELLTPERMVGIFEMGIN